MFGRAIADAKPNYFRWASMERAELRKIGVLGDNREVILCGEAPDLLVQRLEQSTILNMA